MPAGVTFASLTGGRDHTCALAAGGTPSALFCWGSNVFGQSGQTGTSLVSAPTQIFSNLRFRQVEAGRQSTCGIGVDPALVVRAYCWGLDSWGQSGSGVGARGTGPSFATPQMVDLQQ